jgi:2,4-dienoyl-CoA reductase-like NADH-dependent reductase (Old Yellow Enzyme family)
LTRPTAAGDNVTDRGELWVLFSPLALRGVKMRNRVGLAPMSLYSAENHRPTSWHLAHYMTRSQVTGLTIVEATAVSREGPVTAEDLGIWDDADIPAMAQLAAAIAGAGSVPALQLSHAGRKACRTSPWEGDVKIAAEEGGWPIVGPTEEPFADGYAAPRMLTAADIRQVVDDFRQAARRALAAGFQLIELHAGHGRLLHSFYSPIANTRTDRYGGSWQNRTRLLREVVSAVRAVWPDRLPLAVRLSAVDWISGGWQLDDSVALAADLRELGVDLIDCTSGGIRRPISVRTAPGYQVAFARAVREGAGIAAAAVGLISSVQQASQIVDSGSADVVLFGRKMLLDPYFLCAAGETHQPPVPVQYERGMRSLVTAASHHVPEL